MEGVAPSVVKDELNANAARREQLEAPLLASIFGCGGTQPTLSAALAVGGVIAARSGGTVAHLSSIKGGFAD